MTMNEMRAALDAQPFVPFKLHLADGDVLTVPHREFIALSPAGRTVVVFDQDGEMSIVDVLLISRIEMINGQSRKRTKRS